jgi:FkbM family methyltransferase
MSAYIAYARLIKGAKLVAAIGFARRHGIGGDSAPVYLDVGARGGLPPAWSVAARLGLVRPILVEADPTEADRLSDAYQTATVIPYALGSKREVRDLYLTATPGRSSLLMPDPEIVSTLHPTAWAIESIERVETVRLDEIWNRYANDKPSFVKIDTQGFEKEILIGMGAILSDVSCMNLKAHSNPSMLDNLNSRSYLSSCPILD